MSALTFVTKDQRKVQIVCAGAQIGNLNHRQLDEDTPSEVRLICNMYLEGEDAGGPYKKQGVMGFVFAVLIDKGYVLLARHHAGLGREDGSELTQDAPGLIAHMAAKGLVRRYEGP